MKWFGDAISRNTISDAALLDALIDHAEKRGSARTHIKFGLHPMEPTSFHDNAIARFRKALIIRMKEASGDE